MRPSRICAALLALFLPVPAIADTALILSNSRFDGARAVPDARDILGAEAGLEALGYDVLRGSNLTAEGMHRMLTRVLSRQDDARIVIALSGQFAHAGEQSWFLATDAMGADLGSVGLQGMSVDTVMQIAALAPGRAVVMLADSTRRMRLGAQLSGGIGPIDPPQGVTVLTGSPADVGAFLSDAFLEPDLPLTTLLAAADGLEFSGFLSPSLPFHADPDLAPPAPDPAPELGVISPEEQALWEVARDIDGVGAYNAYLSAFPQGAYAEAARARLQALTSDPLYQAERTEESLQLTRADRERVQSDLTVLGYDPGGIDGVFGPGTRRAISSWQGDAGYLVTGFLSGPQIARLANVAAVRRSEIEAEEAVRQSADRRAWDGAQDIDTIAAYEDYIDRFPRGLFVDEAEDRIAALSGPSAADIAAYRRAEAQLGLQPVTRLLVERRLAQAGFNPGTIDGTFDPLTRAAILAFQADRGLLPTGFLNQETVGAMLPDGFSIILR